MRRPVAVVPHTHWDREWYEPFQRFRFRLVGLVDDLLDLLEIDPGFTHFLLDGQTAVLDDYLEVRPQAAPRLRRLVEAGRLAVGPWYTLPDEFLVSGETLVRDLQLGFERSAEVGGAMEVGYLPDMFGHIAQMPQLLRQLGLHHAVVWRGVPAAVDRTAFWWSSPDGSCVRAEYLPQGYGNGADLPGDAAGLVARLDGWAAEFAPLLGDGPLLWMNGSDHRAPDPTLPAVVAAAGELAGDRYELAITSLADHLAAAPTDGLASWQGELRSGARANLLMGVASNRVDVKQAAARAERALERLAEPLQALFVPPGRWPAELLGLAWHQVVRNAAHDSICACSADEVVDAVLHRYAEAATVGEDLAAEALRFVGAQVAAQGPVVVNPSARPRSGLVEIVAPGDTAPPGTQLVVAEPAARTLVDLPAASAVETLAEIVSWTPGLDGAAYRTAPDGVVEVDLFADGRPGEPATRSAVKARVTALADGPGTRVRATLHGRPSVTFLAHAGPVPGFGWQAWSPGRPAVEPVRADAGTLHNGLVTVAVDRAGGTFAVDGWHGLGRLVDGGDAGDTYTWCPPEHDVVVEGPESVRVSVAEPGPLRARLHVDATYRWPARTTAGRRTGEVEVPVRTTVELRAGERLVRVSVEVDNRAEDHRLRAHLPLPQPAVTSRAECAFAVVERGLTAEGGPTEAGTPTFPSRRFVQAGGLTVVHDGLCEYELVDVRDGRAHELALTLLRATGWLSRGPMATRALPAGPPLPTRGAQVPGRHVLRYAVQLGEADPYAVADDALLPLLVAYGAAMGTAPGEHQALAVEGAEVSCVRRVAGGLEVRVFNPSPEPAEVRLPGRSGWLVDLRGRPVEAVDGSFPLRAWGIATALLT